jgi:hypothetical protein
MLNLFLTRGVLLLGILWIILHLVSRLLSAQEPSSNSAGDDQLRKRIDFGNSYIMGQRIKSGAVYIMHRKKSNIRSMLKSRENYRDEILENLKGSSGI